MKVIPEFMEPLFKYAGHGSAAAVKIPNMPQCLEIDVLGRYARRALHLQPRLPPLVARHRRGACAATTTSTASCGATSATRPLDRMMQGQAPGCFCPHCRREAPERGIDVERVRRPRSCEVWDFFRQCAGRRDLRRRRASSSSCACCCATRRCCSGSASGSSARRTSTASSTASSSGAIRRCPSG